MRVVFLSLTGAALLASAGCASTNTESPIYKQSTVYKGRTPVHTGTSAPYYPQDVRPATYTTQPPAPVVYNGSAVINSTAPVGTAPAPEYESIAPPAVGEVTGTPLVEDVQSLGEDGTPGFYAIQAEEGNEFDTTGQTDGLAISAPENAQPAQVQPAQAQPAQAQPTVQTGASAGLDKIVKMNTVSDTVNHTIVTGDTLYSLARKSCSSVIELQRINQIGDDYAIKIGHQLLLPAGQCEK